jgi:glycosyltransferase involved in cell wall biosynthesis
MTSGLSKTLNKFTTFSQEIASLETLRKARRSKIKKYPTLSVLVSTIRPKDLTSLLSQLLQQSLPSFEVRLGLHGVDLDSTHKKQISALNRRKVKVFIEKFDADKTLGTVLSQLASKSNSDFIAKMDDDDFYGPEHLRDLLDAAIDTGAEVVGRAMNYIYLEPLDLTLRKFGGGSMQTVEHFSDWICGGTILAKRTSAQAAGWFGDGKSAVDHFLLNGVTNNGGKIWRTFGAGYIYRRGFTPHTYVTNYSKYLNNVNDKVVGLWTHPIFGEDK